MARSYYKKITAGCGLAVAASGTIVLAGWFLGSRHLIAVRADYIPMAPNTALCFILVGVGLVSLEREQRRIDWSARLAASFVLVLAFLRILEYVTPLRLDVDRWIFTFSNEHLGLVPVGQMAFFTALNFICAAVALFGLACAEERRSSPWAAAFAIITLLIGSVFALGYVYGSPLLYGGATIPMALNTSIAFVLSGLGLLTMIFDREAAERQRTWEALEEAHKELELQVDERTKELTTVNKALQVEIAERKQAEGRIRLQVVALEAAANSIIITDRNGAITWINPAFTRLTGYTAEEAIGRNPYFLKSGQHDQAFYQNLWETILSGRVWQGEIVNRRKDGSLYTEEQTITPVLDGRGEITHFIAIKLDITERTRLEDRLRQAQKLEAVGLLAGGIAHDFNNHLNGIIGFAELALGGIPPDSQEYRHLSRVPQIGRQAADLVSQLLNFARKTPLHRKPLDLNPLLQETVDILRRTLPETIAIKPDPAEKPLTVNADGALVQQILLNLATNARDAMPHGGTLTLRLTPVTLIETSLGGHPERRAGAFACLTVADTGTGIPAAIRDRIFEPFFTTKEIGRGTGLGLASVYGIARQHEGWIEVETAEGQGSAFHVFLPLVPAAKEAAPSAGQTLPRGTETLLLVEDNPMVLELGELLLSNLGYTVLSAANGAEALEIFRAHPDIALVLTDAIMPRMGAAALIPALRALNPSIKVLVATGYAPDEIHHSLESLGVTGYIRKPFSQADLATAVRAAIDGQAPAGRSPGESDATV